MQNDNYAVGRVMVMGPPSVDSRLRSRMMAAYLGSLMNLGTESYGYQHHHCVNSPPDIFC